MVEGDFNTILHLEEREGSGDFDHGAANDFAKAVEELIELDPIGNPYTWMNGAEGKHTRM